MNPLKHTGLLKILLFSFSLIVSIFLVVSVTTFRSVNDLIESKTIEDHTHEVLQVLESIISNMSDAETGQRGYLLTGELKYLEPYNSGVSTVQGTIEEVTDLTADNPNQQERTPKLKNLVEQKKAELQQTVGLRSHGKNDEAIEIVLSDKGKNIMDDIRSVVKEMKDEEENLLAKRQKDALTDESVTKSVIIIGSLIGLFSALAIAVIISQYLGSSLNSLRRVAYEISKGNLNISVNTDSSNEIGQLSRSINAMKENLQSYISQLNQKASQLNSQLLESSKSKKALVISMKDVENEKRMSQNLASDLQKYKLAVDSTSEHITITDPTFKILYVNRAATRITGYQKDELIGKTPLAWAKISDEEFAKIQKIVIQEKNYFEGDMDMQRKDGKSYTGHVTVAPILDNNGVVKAVVGIERDITHEKEVEKAKTEFVSLASHQLKTPATGVKAFLSMLVEGDAGKLTNKQMGFAAQAYQSNERQLRIIEDLLNISRIETGRLVIEKKRFILNELIEDLSKTFSETFKKKEQKLETNLSKEKLTIDGDFEKLWMVVSNVVDNAKKYTKKGGTIELKLTQKDGNAVISVKDTGVGIAKKDLDKLFKKFSRIDNEFSTLEGGTGLGLYLVKNIVDLHGGSIEVESEVGEGSKFSITLPTAKNG